MAEKKSKFNFEKTLQDELLPLAIVELRELASDEDKKVRLQACEDILEMAGKRKRGSGATGVVINLGDLAGSLKRVGEHKHENIPEERPQARLARGAVHEERDGEE